MYEENKYKIFTVLGVIGRYTLGIYLCHFTLINMPFIICIENKCSLLVQFCGLLFLSFGIALLCIGIQKVIGTFSPLHKIMYGK